MIITKKQINKVIRSLKGIDMAFIDLFCGAGGTSTGIERASVNMRKIAKVILCVNHDAFAIKSHEANHPDAIHMVEDVRSVKMKHLIPLIREIRRAYPHIKICIWASLECTNFSKAKGGQPRDEDSRTLAWDLLRYERALRPDKIYIENVEEFMSWGPLDDKGKPISKHAGEDYTKWRDAIKAEGYNFDYRIINSADLGAYQSRKRYFAQFSRPHLSIRWPVATHAKLTKKMPAGAKMWKPVKDVLNLNNHGNSVIDRPKPLVPATINRIIMGVIKHVLPESPEFFIKYFRSVDSNSSINTASPTLTTKDRLALIHAQFLMQQNTNASPGQSLRRPSRTITCTGGNLNVITCDQFIDKAFSSGGRNQSISSPSGAVTTVNKMSLVTNQFLDKQYGSDRNHQSVEDPSGALTANPKFNLVSCQSFLVNPQWFNEGAMSIDKPCPTLIARMDKTPLSVVTTELENAVWVSIIQTVRKKFKSVIRTKQGNLIYVISIYESEAMQKLKLLMACTGIVDVKMRMLEIEELLRIQGFPDTYKLIGTKTKKKWLIGNAVETNTARKLIEANSEDHPALAS